MKSKPIKVLFVEMYLKGIPIAQIAKDLSICRRTVDYWRKSVGLPRRRKL